MRLYEAFQLVTETIREDIKYTLERNENFDEEFLEKVINFLETRCDVLNRAEIRERNWNRSRNLEK